MELLWMADVDERYSHTETKAGLAFMTFNLKQEVLYFYSVIQSVVKMSGTTRGLEPKCKWQCVTCHLPQPTD